MPSETLFYGVTNAAELGYLEMLDERIKKERGLLQIGADITTGLGWCTVALKEVK